MNNQQDRIEGVICPNRETCVDGGTCIHAKPHPHDHKDYNCNGNDRIGCPPCQLFPQPLDDKELREELATILGLTFHKGLRLASDASPSCDFAYKYIAQMPPEIWEEICRAIADEALALLQQKIAQERERIKHLYGVALDLHLAQMLEESYKGDKDYKGMTLELARRLKEELGQALQGADK